MNNTKTIGDAAELRVKMDLIERGYIVSSVEGDNAPYDLVVDVNQKLRKVQVKSRTPKNNKIEVQLFSMQYEKDKRKTIVQK